MAVTATKANSYQASATTTADTSRTPNKLTHAMKDYLRRNNGCVSCCQINVDHFLRICMAEWHLAPDVPKGWAKQEKKKTNAGPKETQPDC
ncbi:BQ5605_C044g12154 [Microbotryum silenes-dioicae]|uniref:BQ5605_C044g12154 protein n=1 Tax=Microbotryum silenes-dioicae TaxID=796604 RepID=A0A2X0MQ99_9BASI|nr:BQ5605_C044g12154 [Microbotryum silenes-dioicae]